ncbi:MAG: alkaline phosphatase family protein, partial [Acidimicrobiia bacterium]
MNCVEVFGGVIQPFTQVGTAAPTVGGGLAGVGGAVGEAVIADGVGVICGVVVTCGVGVRVTAGGVLPPQPTKAPAVSAAATDSPIDLRKRCSEPHRETRGGYRPATSLIELKRMPDRVHPNDEERGDAHPLPVSRRKFLQRSAMAIAGGALFSCTGGRVIRRVTPSVTPSIETRWPIKQVLYIMLENRSFDNLFGKFPGVNGTSVGVEYGKQTPLLTCPDWLPGDLPHDRAAALNCLNGGKLDGFGTGLYGPRWSYTQFNEQEIPNYWYWAREYAISDNFFASALGPSYPNHFFLISGQSGGVIDNPENIETRVTDGGQKKFKSWGCDALGNDVFVFVKDAQGNLTKHDSCFSFRTVGEQLTGKGVDWAFYSAPPGMEGYFWNAYNGIHQVFHSDLWHEHIRSTETIIDDVKA